MRPPNDGLRVLSVVGLSVTVALAIAGFANSDADAHAVAANMKGPVSSSETSAAAGPARPVRVVYSGPIVATGTLAGDRPAAQTRSQRSTERAETSSPSVVQLASLPARPVAEDDLSTSALPRAGLDLNSASIEQLNALGGGRIGRAIARGRPYSSPDDLLRKRILTRETYAQIKHQVQAR